MIWILKVTAVLGLLFGVSALLRRATAAHRHLVWGVGLASLLAVPLISSAVPWRLPVLPAAELPVGPPAEKPDKAQVAASPENGTILAAVDDNLEPTSVGVSTSTGTAPVRGPYDWGSWLPILWLVGAGLMSLRWLLGLGGAWGIRRASRPLDDARWHADLQRVCGELSVGPVELLATDARVMPFTVGLARPAVIVPAVAAEWTPAQRLDVLRHELAHIKRRDGLWHLVGHAACAVYWFHPLVWLAARRLRAECERACDAIVLSAGTRPSTYAQHLLDVVRRADAAAVPPAVLAMARRTEFEGRLLAILEHTGGPVRPSRPGAAAVAAAVVALVLPLAAIAPIARDGAPLAEPEQLRAETEAPADPAPAVPQTQADLRVDDVAGTDIAGAESRIEEDDARPVQVGDRSVVAALAARLTDPDIGVREAVAMALARHQDTVTINALSRALRSDASPAVRRAAAWALGEIEDARAVPALVGALRSDTDPGVRRAAAEALGQIESPAAVEGLSEAVRAERIPAIRRAVIEALGSIDDARAVPALVPTLSDSAVEIRVAAAEALGNIEEAAAVEPLARLLRDPSVVVRRVAAEALGNIEDRRAVPGLLTALDDDDRSVRVAVVEALGNIEDPSATDRLVQALSDRDAQVRHLVVEALGNIADSRAVDGLMRVLRSDSMIAIRVEAAEALGNIESARALPALTAALGDASAEVRRAAVAAIGNVEDLRTAPPELIRAIGDSDPRVRYEAIQAAGSIEDPAVVSALLAQLNDESTQIRRAVIAALADIDSPEAYRALVAALDSDDPEIRRLAARALGNR